MAEMNPFVETLNSKDELFEDFKKFAERKVELGQNALLAHYGLCHGGAITKYCNGKVEDLMNFAEIPTTSIAYFQAGIRAWSNLYKGLTSLPEPAKSGREERKWQINALNDADYYNPYLNAIRTKPFLLLAGISGTGKSRKVQELAYLTCKRDGIHDQDETAPGNYLLIPVKPNWHDSTELLGYYSSITGKYMITDFIRFVWKAIIHKDVPYFLCLDEMNLAPVEQYFAEYLSILETRKLVYNNQQDAYEIRSAEILPKKQFESLELYAKVNRKDVQGDDDVRTEYIPLYKGEDVQIINFLKENGLRLPENLFVIGTVNMDDTTHQFSRKVIDRAFTIEMNGEELTKMFDAEDTLTYQKTPMFISELKPRFVRAQEVLEAYSQDAGIIKDYVPQMLNRINGEGIFKDTPFRVSYRVQNELVLYYAAIRPKGDLAEEQVKVYLQDAFMTVLLEKVLPRVEGDEKAMRCNEKGDSMILQNLMAYLKELIPIEGMQSRAFTVLLAKLNEMNERVKNSYFTSFFS